MILIVTYKWLHLKILTIYTWTKEILTTIENICAVWDYVSVNYCLMSTYYKRMWEKCVFI